MNNSIRNSILFWCFILYSFTAYTQNKTIDSLQKVLATEKEDTNKVSTLLTFCRKFDSSNNYKNLMLYAKEALSLSEKINFDRGEAKAYTSIGAAYDYQNDFNDAIGNFLKALKIYQETRDSIGAARSYYYIGNIYNQPGNYPDAIKNFYNALKIYEELEDKKHTALILSNLGNEYQLQNNYSEALNNYHESLKTYEEIGDTSLHGELYYGIVRLNLIQGKFAEAIRFDSILLKKTEQSGDKDYIGWSYFEFGEIYQKLGDLNKAKDRIVANKNYIESRKNYLNAVKSIRESGESPSDSGYIYQRLGLVSVRLNNLKGAKDYLQISLQATAKAGYTDELQAVYSAFTVLDSAQGNYRQAFEDYKIYIVYRDSINNDETAKKSLLLKMQYDSDKKEALEKAEREKEQVAEERKQNLEYLAIISLIILVLAFLFIATRTTVPLKWIDITGFVGVLLFFQFLETLLHPTITKYTHGSPLLFMGINIALASSIKPLHHTIEKRLIKISHSTTEKRRLKKLKLEEERRRKAEEQRRADEERQQDDDFEKPI